MTSCDLFRAGNPIATSLIPGSLRHPRPLASRDTGVADKQALLA